MNLHGRNVFLDLGALDGRRMLKKNLFRAEKFEDFNPALLKAFHLPLSLPDRDCTRVSKMAATLPHCRGMKSGGGKLVVGEAKAAATAAAET
ncbi:hypothetical protein RUM44_000328 [Polyplax serrata]|uniref:Uncharacterized protein n=1 Tax=Polyplax serrata TaxID=468196 RepID=A0ABR1B573_POLSC